MTRSRIHKANIIDDRAVEVDDRLVLYGFSSQGCEKTIRSDVSSSKILSGFGDHMGLKGVITETGTIYLFRRLDDQVLELQRHRTNVVNENGEEEATRIQHISVAGNGRVCVSIGMPVLKYIFLVPVHLTDSQPAMLRLYGPRLSLLDIFSQPFFRVLSSNATHLR